MADDSDSRTSTTLLRRLRDNPTDGASWDRFVERYGILIYRWCRHWGLQEADAEDVTQNVLVELVRQMRNFEYDKSGSFRAWLRTVAYRAWCRFIEGRQKRGAAADAAIEKLQTNDAYEDLLSQFLLADDKETLEHAMNLVRLRVQPHTWEAFRMLALEGRSGREVAEALKMTTGAAFVARSKVQRMLREEVARLTEGDTSGSFVPPNPTKGATS